MTLTSDHDFCSFFLTLFGLCNAVGTQINTANLISSDVKLQFIYFYLKHLVELGKTSQQHIDQVWAFIPRFYNSTTSRDNATLVKC